MEVISAWLNLVVLIFFVLVLLVLVVLSIGRSSWR
jgi:hypothetical protein